MIEVIIIVAIDWSTWATIIIHSTILKYEILTKNQQQKNSTSFVAYIL